MQLRFVFSCPIKAIVFMLSLPFVANRFIIADNIIMNFSFSFCKKRVVVTTMHAGGATHLAQPQSSSWQLHSSPTL